MEQKREHDLDAQNKRQEDKDYANQTAAITQMRQILEDEAATRKRQMVKEM